MPLKSLAHRRLKAFYDLKRGISPLVQSLTCCLVVVATECRTSASWLNLVEGWFSILTRRCLQRGTFVSTDSLKAAIQDYIEQTNRDPKPFVWTKSADEILASIKRFCQRTLNSHH